MRSFINITPQIFKRERQTEKEREKERGGMHEI